MWNRLNLATSRQERWPGKVSVNEPSCTAAWQKHKGGRPSLLVAPTPSKSKVAAKRRRQLGKKRRDLNTNALTSLTIPAIPTLSHSDSTFCILVYFKTRDLNVIFSILRRLLIYPKLREIWKLLTSWKNRSESFTAIIYTECFHVISSSLQMSGSREIEKHYKCIGYNMNISPLLYIFCLWKEYVQGLLFSPLLD